MILCCGEALIDMIPTARAPGRPAWAAYPGGAVFNTAVALGRLEVPAGLLTGLSTDGFGDMLRAALDVAGADCRLSVTTARKTTLAFVTLSDGHATYSFHDEGSALRMLRAEDIPPLPETVRALFFGGISLVSEPCGGAFETLQRREGTDRVVMLDPNIRPSFVTDETAYRGRIDRMIARADIVKVSDEDLDWLDEADRPLVDRMRALCDRGPKIVVVTRGAAGALAVTRSGLEIVAPARSVPVVDTVGAGDTFNAGFLARLHDLDALDKAALEAPDEAMLRAALDHGVAAAAIVVTRAGAQPPSRDELSGPTDPSGH
jgi:fructokinase